MGQLRWVKVWFLPAGVPGQGVGEGDEEGLLTLEVHLRVNINLQVTQTNGTSKITLGTDMVVDL